MIKNSETKLTLTPPLRGGREGLLRGLERLIIVPILLAIILLSSACKSKKIITDTTTTGNSKYQIVTLVQSAQPNYTTANVSKLNISLQAGGQNLNSPATCRIYRDSVIHLSIQPFMGIEVFRLELSKPYARVIDKMNSTYYEMTYDEMAKLWGVTLNFFDLQAAVTNQLFCIGQNKEIDNITVYPANESKQEIRYETQQLTQKTVIDKEYQIRKLEIKAKNDNVGFQIMYENFQAIRGINSPQKLVMEIINGNIPIRCGFDVSRIAFNEEIRLTPTNVERYTRGSIQDLKNKIQK